MLLLDDYEPLVSSCSAYSSAQYIHVLSDPKRSHRLLSAEGWLRDRRRTVVRDICLTQNVANIFYRKRLLALAAQKFVADISADAYQHARIRTNAAAGNRGRAPMGQPRVSICGSFLVLKP